MKITTRIALGLGVMAIFMATALAYQIGVIHRLEETTDELSRTSLEASRISVRLLQNLDGVREFSAKSLLLGDEDYRVQWDQWEDAVDTDLVQLRELDQTGAEREILERIEAEWLQHRAQERFAPSPLETSPAELDAALTRIEDRLGTVRALVDDMITANQATVAARAQEASEIGAEARVVSGVAAGGGLILALLISTLIYLSISTPLRRLVRGTRELARGRFDHRLDADGGDELSDLARDFNRMAAQLAELDDMKRDFVSHVSHELKGPLAAIHETILVLLEGIPGPLTEDQEHFLQLSHHSAHRLSAMISNLLELSRVEAGVMEYTPSWVSMEASAGEVLEELQPLSRERKIADVLETNASNDRLYCDRGRIQEVLSNLVENAFKFSPEGGTVRVAIDAVTGVVSRPEVGGRKATAGVEGERYLLVSVEDEGFGIVDEHKEGVFERFYQVQREGRIHGQGVGLGLHISRKIVEAHEGEIWVEDAPEGGALFRVLLPRLPSQWEERSAERAAANGGDPGSSDARRREPLVANAPESATAVEAGRGSRTGKPEDPSG